jgi:ATP-dependent protease ClpP protease subunit
MNAEELQKQKQALVRWKGEGTFMGSTTVAELMKGSEQSVLKKRKEMLNRTSDHRRWYSISNKAGDVAEVRIYDEIGWFGITAEDFVKDLDDITASKMTVAINCPGGDVFDGIAIYNALRTHPAEVTTRVDSLAASIASVIAQAGDERIILTGGQMMIHDAWGLAMGNADDMREMADLLEKQSTNIANIYANRSGKDASHYRELMAKESWFDDEESVTEGLADEVVDPSKAKNLAKRTLNDELEETMAVISSQIESAERVAAHRAEKDKPLSAVNRASLDELRENTERLQRVLAESVDPASLDGDVVSLDAALAQLLVDV